MSPQQSVGAAKAEHCYYCFEQINAHLAGSDEDEVGVEFDHQGKEYPLFITWNIYSASALSKLGSTLTGSGSSPRLRGCIGTFEPLPLKEGLKDYAEIAAFKDRRFSPISKKELPRLECGVSLLTRFEDCDDYLDWDIGTHGIYIHLPNPASIPPSLDSDVSSSSSGTSSPTTTSTSARHSSSSSARRSEPRILTATYLPDVMPAQGWTKVEAIDSAIRKAGYEGRITEATRKSLRVRRYQSEKCTKGADEWLKWREEQKAKARA